MRTKEEILKSKFDHYGETKAAIDFAMREYAEEFALDFGIFIEGRDTYLERKTIADMLNEFKVKTNL